MPRATPRRLTPPSGCVNIVCNDRIITSSINTVNRTSDEIEGLMFSGLGDANTVEAAMRVRSAHIKARDFSDHVVSIVAVSHQYLSTTPLRRRRREGARRDFHFAALKWVL